MTKRHIYNLCILVIVIGLGVMASCTQERQPCAQPTTATLTMHCFQAVVDTNNAVVISDTSLPNPLLAVIDTDGAAVAYYYGIKNISTFSIFLSPRSDSCRWLISPDSTFTNMDTITFHYSHTATFINNSCGYTYNYNLDSVVTTKHSIDSVIIENRSVNTKANVEHLKVYINP